MTKFQIQDFYSKRFESESTQLLFEDPAMFSHKAMENYIYQVTGYPLEEYICYRIKFPITSEITSKDITQLSSFEDCTTNMCKMMILNRNSGLTLPQIASQLHIDNNYKDNLVALTKYGENQVKTACQLGLAVMRNNLWYLSSIGVVFPLMPDNVKQKFFSICLLRDSFYSKVLCSMYQRETNLVDYMTILSVSTQKRRSSSCMRLINIFVQQCKAETINIFPIISKFK